MGDCISRASSGARFFRNARGLSVLRALAMSASTSCRVGTAALSTIAAVNANVAFSKVTGPKLGFAFALAANAEANMAILRIQLRLHLIFVEVNSQALAAHRNSLQFDIDILGLERRSGV